MRFRHPHGVRLALTSGHVTIVGPEWRPLRPEFHREAMAKGCECDQSTVRTQPQQPPKASDQAVVPLAEADQIRKVLIVMVDRNAEDDFTTAGTPNLTTLAKELGFRPEKETALAVWHQLVEEAGGSGQATEGATGEA